MDIVVCALGMVAVWLTILTHKNNKQKRRNDILSAHNEFLMGKISQLLKYNRLNPENNGKENQSEETQEGCNHNKR